MQSYLRPELWLRLPRLWRELGLLQLWSQFLLLFLQRLFVALDTRFVRVLALHSVRINVTVFAPRDTVDTQSFLFEGAVFILETPSDAAVGVVGAVLAQNLDDRFATTVVFLIFVT